MIYVLSYVLGIPLIILIHELGHLACAIRYSNGKEQIILSLGETTDSPNFKFKIGGVLFKIKLNTIFITGSVYPGNAYLNGRQMLLFFSSGILAQLFVCGFVLLLTINTTNDTIVVCCLLFLTYNALIAIFNLIPSKFYLNAENHGYSDGYFLFHLLFNRNEIVNTYNFQLALFLNDNAKIYKILEENENKLRITQETIYNASFFLNNNRFKNFENYSVIKSDKIIYTKYELNLALMERSYLLMEFDNYLETGNPLALTYCNGLKINFESNLDKDIVNYAIANLFCKSGEFDWLIKTLNRFRPKTIYEYLDQQQWLCRASVLSGKELAALTAYYAFKKKMDKDDDRHKSILGYLARKIGKNHDYLQTFDSLLKKQQEDSNLYNARGYGYLEMGEYEKAITDFETCLNLSHYNNAYANNNLGKAMLLTGKLETGLKYILHSRTLEPANFYTHQNEGIYYLLKQDYPRALELFLYANERDHSIDWASFYLGMAYYGLGEFDAAEKAIHLAVRQNIAPAREFRALFMGNLK